LRKHYKSELDRHFAWFERRLPPWAARFVAWLRKPSSRLVRIPLAILLIAGGFFSFLPVLGLWMLPLGLLLFAQDVPMLQKPMVQMLGWIERKWIERQRAKSAQ
jgi:membrane-bound ClpP family serine protease